LLSFAFALLVAIGPGCGSSEDSSGSSGTSGTCGTSTPGGAEACAKYLDARKQCRGSVSPSREAEYGARLQRSCEALVAAPGSGYTAALLDGCTAEIRAACWAADACDRPFDDLRGTLAAGAACADDVQCASGKCKKEFASNGEGYTFCGTCAAAKQVGEACDAGDACVSGAVCWQRPEKNPSPSSVPVCTAIREVGEGDACAILGEPPVICVKGLYCSSEPNQPRRCMLPVGEGEPCGTGDVRCATPLQCVDERCGPRVYARAGEACSSTNDCERGLVCDAKSKTCASVVWGPIGAACDAVRRCDPGYCAVPDANVGGSVGTCVDYAADGDPCEASYGDGTPPVPQCDVAASCRDGRCQFFDPQICK
jgi:hypothetical protein